MMALSLHFRLPYRRALIDSSHGSSVRHDRAARHNAYLPTPRTYFANLPRSPPGLQPPFADYTSRGHRVRECAARRAVLATTSTTSRTASLPANDDGLLPECDAPASGVMRSAASALTCASPPPFLRFACGPTPPHSRALKDPGSSHPPPPHSCRLPSRVREALEDMDGPGSVASMSQHSDEALLVAGSDSFWEPGNYKRTSKRTEDGHRLCSELIQLVQERSEVEKAYAKGLKAWSRKWAEQIDKGPEYGTTEAAWKGALQEADRTCEMHLRVRDKLLNEVVPQIKTWQKENYHRSMMQLRERRELDEAFKKAQKPWAKLLDRVNKARSDYHTACKAERSATNQERNAGADSSLSPDQVKKLQDRVAKCKEEVQRTRERYEAALQEINDYNAKYMEDMTVVFDKCQEFEQRRLKFFKDMLFAIHGCLNISTDPE
ncbi:hypothetical protein HPB50_001527 [Hyalomma asiaticum]|uniref:Uncharacterized protein n=1 Tax=Hyalomma asiaticum TaxID=266040 RepID=A0ACB7SJ01_HYAAI|nr:hypothetical protein HPB50_001527 [Hyalomma asiaticum]